MRSGADLVRVRHTVTERSVCHIEVAGRQLLQFSSNDYLGLSQHPAVIEAVVSAVTRYGWGSGGSAQVSGYSEEHERFECEMADYLGMEAAVLCPSGYHANVAVIQSFFSRHDTVLSDRLVHASLLDAIQLSRSRHIRYQHCDITSVSEALLQSDGQCAGIVTDAVFSMSGDVAPLRDLADQANRHNVPLFVDDAHGFGVLGDGRGSCEAAGVTSDVFALIVPLGKAMGGCGGVVAGSRAMVEQLMQRGRTYRYTTAAPPASVAALRAALRVLQCDDARRDRLQARRCLFQEMAAKFGLPLVSGSPTAIQGVCVGDAGRVMALQAHLMAAGFFVGAMRPPTVPVGSSQLRISLCSEHREEDIVLLVEEVARFLEAGDK